MTNGRPGREGTGEAVTVIVNVLLSDADALSVTVYVTVHVPRAVGVPLTVRFDAVNDSPAGRPLTLYVYGGVPPLAKGSVNDVCTSFVNVQFCRSGRVKEGGVAMVVAYRLGDQPESPALLPARTWNS